MSLFDLEKSLERARRRLGEPFVRTTRKRRSDRGASRLDPAVIACVADELSGQERPRVKDLLSSLGERCRREGHAPPSRATVYKLMATIRGPTHRRGDLPDSVQSALYNLDDDSEVPAHQVAYYCFNYGELPAVSFAAGLPWLALYQARRLPGYRRKSRGLIEAVLRVRKI